MIDADRRMTFVLSAGVAVLGGVSLLMAPSAIWGLAIAPVLLAGAVLYWGALRGSRIAILTIVFASVFLLDATFRLRDYSDKDVDFQIILKIGIWLTLAGVALVHFPRWLPWMLTPTNLTWMAFLAWLMFTATLSPIPAYSMMAAFSIISYVLFSAYLFSSFDRAEIFTATLLAIILFCIVSIIVYFAVPEFGRFIYWFNDQRYVSLRMSGIGGSANNLARIAVFGLILIILHAADFRRLHAFFVPFAASILTITLLMTNSRSSIAMTLGLWISVSLLRWRKLYLLVLIVSAALLAAVLVLPVENEVLRLMSRTGDLDEITSMTGRASIWSIVPHLIAGQSWIGLGYASSLVILPQHSREIGFLASHAHNQMLQLLLTTGWIGVTLFCLSILAVGVRAAYFADRTVLVLLAYVLLNGLTESSAFGTVANICTLAFAIAVTLPPGWNIYESDRSYQRGLS